MPGSSLASLAYFDALFISPILAFGPLTPSSSSSGPCIAQTAMPLCLMVFGIYFPERSDARHPVPLDQVALSILLIRFASCPSICLQSFGHYYNFASCAALDPYL